MTHLNRPKIKNFNFLNSKIANVPISIIPSVLLIAIAVIFYSQKSLGLTSATIALAIFSYVVALISQKRNLNVKPWHILLLGIALMAIFQDSIVHAQILDGIEDALTSVGTAAGGSFAAEVISAIVDLIRIVLYIVVAGVIVAAIFFGVAQNQWQAPILVIAVIAGITLFLELMGQVVFGG